MERSGIMRRRRMRLQNSNVNVYASVFTTSFYKLNIWRWITLILAEYAPNIHTRWKYAADISYQTIHQTAAPVLESRLSPNPASSVPAVPGEANHVNLFIIRESISVLHVIGIPLAGYLSLLITAQMTWDIAYGNAGTMSGTMFFNFSITPPTSGWRERNGDCGR